MLTSRLTSPLCGVTFLRVVVVLGRLYMLWVTCYNYVLYGSRNPDGSYFVMIEVLPAIKMQEMDQW